MKTIVDYYLQKRKRLYCAFIDYKKAFDLIDRKSLWLKILKTGVSGKVLNVVMNLYKHAKSCISANGNMSDFLTCNVGVRQGENLEHFSNLFCLLYADDTIILAESPDELQV